MNPINGYKLSEMIRNYLLEYKIEQPMIVLCSGDNIKMNESICYDHGVNTIIKKPVDLK